MEKFLFQQFSVILAISIVILCVGVAMWYAEEDKSIYYSKRIGSTLTWVFGVFTLIMWVATSNEHYTEREVLTRALYDHNITLKGYESINEDYTVEDFRKGLK